jgi:hypothetical protein
LNFEYSSDSNFDFSSLFTSSGEGIMSTLNFNLALKLIPAFDGSAGALLKFIEMTDTVFTTATMLQDNSLLLSLIYSKLEGQAFEYSREAVYPDWPALKMALQKKFAPTKTVAQFQQDQPCRGQPVKPEKGKV